MRFQIDCTNPDTRQRHQFELECPSAADARTQLLARGLVIHSLEPASDTPPAPQPRHWTKRTLVFPAEESRRERAVTRVVGYIMIGLLVVLILGAALSRAAPVSHQRLKARVQYDGVRLRITNAGDVAWREVLFDLNGGLANAGYQARTISLNPDRSVTIAVGQFTNERGERFDPSAEPLRQLRIYCDLGEGEKGLFNRRFDK